jgi:hypothetical protein
MYSRSFNKSLPFSCFQTVKTSQHKTSPRLQPPATLFSSPAALLSTDSAAASDKGRAPRQGCAPLTRELAGQSGPCAAPCNMLYAPTPLLLAVASSSSAFTHALFLRTRRQDVLHGLPLKCSFSDTLITLLCSVFNIAWV